MMFWRANEPFVISGLIILTGYLLKRLDILNESGGEVLAKVALNVTLPAIILLNVPAVVIDTSNILLPVFGLGSAALMSLAGLFVFRKQAPMDRGLSMTASAGYNIGLFAIPMVAGLYGVPGIIRYAIFDIGNIFAIFGLSWYLAWYYSPFRGDNRLGIRGILRMFFGSIPFMATLVAIAMNIAGLRFDGLTARFLDVPAAMNRGVSLLTLGVLLKFNFSPETWKAIIPSLALRYTVGVVVGTLVLFLLPISVENRVSMAGALVMPVGLAIIPYSVRWGYDRVRAAAILNVGIPISFILFWLVWVASTYIPALQP